MLHLYHYVAVSEAPLVAGGRPIHMCIIRTDIPLEHLQADAKHVHVFVITRQGTSKG